MTVREALTFDLSEVYAKLEGMEAKIDAAIRPAAQAGAQVLYEEARRNAPVKTGRLRDAIYQKFVEEESGPKKATYKVSWRTGMGSSALPSAPHGHWFEYGWWQRYEMAKNEAGDFIGPMRQPGTENMKKPGKYASQAVKDAYWVPKKGGPVWHVPVGMMRKAWESKRGAAIAAIEAKLVEEISK